MSLEDLLERSRLSRLPDDTRCVAVVIFGDKRFEQDQYSLRVSVKNVFPAHDATEEELYGWADRVKVNG